MGFMNELSFIQGDGAEFCADKVFLPWKPKPFLIFIENQFDYILCWYGLFRRGILHRQYSSIATTVKLIHSVDEHSLFL